MTRTAKVDDVQTYHRLQTIPGVGKVLALILLYEMHDVQRFERAGQFLSYARLVHCAHESAGKKLGSGGKKIGNAHLRWALAEAACLFLRSSARAKQWKQTQAARRGDGKALAILAARLGRAVYHMLASAKRSTRRVSGKGRPDPQRQAPLLYPARRRVMPGIDFREARAQVPLSEVFDLIGFAPRWRSGDEVRGPCPVHRARTSRSRSFAANLQKGVWHCFRCGAGGNVLDLWLAVTRQALYPGVIDLYRRLGREVPWLQPTAAPVRRGDRKEKPTMPNP